MKFNAATLITLFTAQAAALYLGTSSPKADSQHAAQPSQYYATIVRRGDNVDHYSKETRKSLKNGGKAATKPVREPTKKEKFFKATDKFAEDFSDGLLNVACKTYHIVGKAAECVDKAGKAAKGAFKSCKGCNPGNTVKDTDKAFKPST
ncbi:hypothetical protein DSO57_1039153 [Entomophthora muscae]|uniref:Uncharacterized protein n=2 Tax=Entomophthora muscae TaxID=34485 RepID=A0ACC2SXH6_9FUNG|nr:hypothetical protein DSO57_1004085 [Entomophthora muscae]KAJ9079084.1 hypothetical protein DSO57_1039153 [Entomophthora muscae]